MAKVVLNMGLGEGVTDKKKVEAAIAELELIAGQKPLPTKSKKSIAGFKLRDGMVIGAKVTLRRDHMFELIMIKWIRFVVWTLLFKPVQKQMKKPKHYWQHSRSHSEINLNGN